MTSEPGPYETEDQANDTFPARGAVEWQWTIGEIVTAVVAAGMELLSLYRGWKAGRCCASSA